MKKRIRLLFISRDKYPPFRVDASILFGKELQGRGHIVNWILQSEEDCATSYRTEWNNSEVWVGSTNNGSERMQRLGKYVRDAMHDLLIFKLSKYNRYDLIQVKDKFFAALLALIVARMYGAKFTYWLSYPYPESDLYAVREGVARYPIFYFLRGNVFKYLLYSVIMKKADHVFVQSEQMKKDVIKNGIAEEKITAVPMGIDLEMIASHDNTGKVGHKRKEKIILYLGTLIRDRKLDFLVRVAAKVVQECPEAKLYFVGSGETPEDESFLKNEANKHGIEESVVFTGFLPRSEALDLVQRSSVCVSPFYPTPILNSTSPTKLIEYMALGKAVVANDHPDQSLVISESGCGICVPYDEKEFTGAILHLLKNPELAEEMGIKGKAYVENNRSYRRIADGVEQIYRMLCEC